MNLRLFAIRVISTRALLPNLYFGSKPEAKAERDKLGRATHCVTYGPDHRHFRR